MIERLSKLFVRTLREDPADAEVPSHKLMVRAGYIRRVAPGVYSWLPLGLRALRKVEAVVREEMDAIGAQELQFPVLVPRDLYEVTGRWTEYGDALLRLKDRKGADLLLGPTHEELFTQTVKDMFSSYKDFPTTLYQIQNKYRDEERPRAGVLRGREFVMKDSYSFDLDDEGLAEAYARHRAAYRRIFDRLGIDYVICRATSGAMGGSASEEFLAVSPSGEDTFVRATEGDYAANVEAVVTKPGEPRPIEGQPEAAVVETPGATTIESLLSWAHDNDVTIDGHPVDAEDVLKTVVIKVTTPVAAEDGEGAGEDVRLVGVAVPGDREVDLKRLEAAVEPAVVELAEEADFAAHPFLVKGFVGPRALEDHGLEVWADPRVAEGSSWLVGGDEPDRHVLGAVAGRDFHPTRSIEAAEVREGDPAPDGQGVLELARGIEIGHIFQLGRKYTDAFEVAVQGEDGKPVTPTMGSYGIGVSRVLAVIAEQTHDEQGLSWPVAVAPYHVHVIAAAKGEEALAEAERLAGELSDEGLDVLLDDRPKVSPGVRFKDAELLGMPFSLVVGRGFADGKLELRVRGGEAGEVPAEEAVDRLLELVEQARRD